MKEAGHGKFGSAEKLNEIIMTGK